MRCEIVNRSNFFFILMVLTSCSANIHLKSDSSFADIQKANRIFSNKTGKIIYLDGTSEAAFVQHISRDSVYLNSGIVLTQNITEIELTKKGGGFFLGMVAGAAPGIIGTMVGTNKEGINPSPIFIILGGAVGAAVGLMIDFKDHLRFESDEQP